MNRWNGLMVGFCLMTLSFVPTARAGEDLLYYQKAKDAVEQGQRDFAFMQLQTLLRSFPDSRFRPEALFGVGEFYAFIPQWDEAVRFFRSFHEGFADHQGSLFALAYLLKAARARGDTRAQERYEQEIMASKRVGLIFREHKDLVFESILGHRYRARFFIDKIEFFVDDQPFLEITY